MVIVSNIIFLSRGLASRSAKFPISFQILKEHVKFSDIVLNYPPQGFGSAGIKPTMAFIDGGYVRKFFKDNFRNDNIDYNKLGNFLLQTVPIGGSRLEIIRYYYYDAIVENTQPDYQQQKEYFQKIERVPWFEVRLGRLEQRIGRTPEAKRS